MRPATLAARSLRHYWRTHAAVVLGVATATAVLTGSLVVGDSVRASLAGLALERIGRATHAVRSTRFVREVLASDVSARGGGATAPLVAVRGAVGPAEGGRRAGDVFVYGVDERFFALHGVAMPEALAERGALLSPALDEELRVATGAALVVLAPPASDIPGSTLFGRRDTPAARLRLTCRGVLPRTALGELALDPTPAEVRAVFVPLAVLQRALGVTGRVNTILAAAPPTAAPAAAVSGAATLEDLGLRLRALPARGVIAVESAAALVDDRTAEAARATAAEVGFGVRPVLVYLATALRRGEREVPYSLVAGLDPADFTRVTGVAAPGATGPPAVVLNTWAAEDLGSRPGDEVTLAFDLWRESGRMEAGQETFRVAGTVPLAGEAADADLVQEYPGLTDAADMAEWDPPFPVDLARIRPRDEAYWDEHRATPKAFVQLDDAQRLWSHRLGRLSSLRLVPPPGADLEAARATLARALAARLLAGPPDEALARAGLVVTPLRERALLAARGSTDFGEYFGYFSFFLAVSALLLAGLFFRLGLEQRLVELGLLRAVGFAPRGLDRLYLAEGLALAAAGAVAGAALAGLYAHAIVFGLSTVWSGAVGTTDLEVHVRPRTLAAGAMAGLAAALVTILLTLRGLRSASVRTLLGGALPDDRPLAETRGARVASGVATLALLASGLGALRVVPAGGAFFASGALLLVAVLGWTRAWLRRRDARARGLASVTALGVRAARFRPGRSLVCVGLVAAASFVVVSVGAFRRDRPPDLDDPKGESGGFRLLGGAVRGLHHDPRTAEGRAALGLPEPALADATLFRFRRSDGEDASCLNLYRPTRPTVLGAEPAFVAANRFTVVRSLAESEADRANPWRLLDRDLPDGALPALADATTLQYVLKIGVGDTVVLEGMARVRIVGALRPGLLQGPLVVGERHFQRAFPDEDGYRSFLVAAPAARADAVGAALEGALGDFGFDVVDAGARLAALHRVENTYIATFQSLGALGLLLGTVGLAAVLLRNAFERRRELALLRAVGYRPGHLRRLLLGENAFLLGAGLLGGLAPALVAIAPALVERGAGPPLLTVAAVAGLLLLAGLGVSLVAVAVVRRWPLLAALRSE